MLADASETVQIIQAIFAGLMTLVTFIAGVYMWRVRQGQIQTAERLETHTEKTAKSLAAIEEKTDAQTTGLRLANIPIPAPTPPPVPVKDTEK